MREIVTLQLGHLNNYTATHFWNTQESYFTYSNQESSPINHNVHWREGLGADGTETFLPRTVIYDLKGGFGSLRKTNALFEGVAQVRLPVLRKANLPKLTPPRSGQTVPQKQPAIEPSAYQTSLDAGTKPSPLNASTVRYWSDFTRVFYHPKSITQLYDYELNSTVRPFERHSMGVELFDTIDKENDIVDRDFRPFVEECDRMQGIQAFATIDDAWGGFASKYLDALRDEYPKTCIWLWGLQSPVAGVTREKRQLRQVNTAQAIAHSSSSASMVVPLSIPERDLPSNVKVDLGSQWSVSGVLSTAIESALLESRMAIRNDIQPASLWDTVECLNQGGNQRLARLRMSVGSLASDAEEKHNEVDLLSLGQPERFAKKTSRSRVFGQSLSLRGLGHDTEEGTEEEPQPPLRRLAGDTITHKFSTPLKFPLLDSFPEVYNVENDDSIDVRATLSTETNVGSRIKNLQSTPTWSIPRDEREDLSNALSELIDGYQDGWSSGSDEDEDDM